MRPVNPVIVVAVAVLAAAPLLAADKRVENKDPGENAARLATTSLVDLLDVVRRKTGRVFVIDSRVRPEVVTGQLVSKKMNYATLLLVLRNNDLAAIEVGDVTNVVPVANVRQHPLPIIHEDDDSIDDLEWVTRVVQVEKAEARQLVPILRPLVPKQGHLVAHPASNTLTIVDRYGNAQRIVELIRSYDQKTRQ